MMVEFDYAHIKSAYRRFWDGSLGRPIISATAYGKKVAAPEPSTPPFRFTSAYDLTIPARKLIERIDWDLSRCDYLYDSYPAVPMQFFGPGVLAAFLGATPHPAEHTVWFDTPNPLPIKELHFEYKPDCVWFDRVKDIYYEGSRFWNGNVLMEMTDLGGILDVLSSFRGAENLLIDLIEYPDEVERCVKEIQALWFRYYDEINRIIAPTTPGYTHWAQIYDENPTYILQSDFSYMIGPDMFNRFVGPELASSSARMSHTSYHLDGIGELPHLDTLMGIDTIALIQWVPGSGEPETRDWSAVYRRITEKKKIYFYSDVAKLEYILKTVDPVKVFTPMSFDAAEKERTVGKIDALLYKYCRG